MHDERPLAPVPAVPVSSTWRTPDLHSPGDGTDGDGAGNRKRDDPHCAGLHWVGEVDHREE